MSGQKAILGILLCFLLAGILMVGAIIYGFVSPNEYYYEELPDEPAYPVYYQTLSAQEGHSLAITADGRVFTWGQSAETLAGEEITAMMARSFHSPYAHVENAVAVFGWRDFNGVIDRRGDVWVWGGNWEGRLAEPSSLPTRLTDLENVKYIWVNNRFFVVLTRDGRAYIRTADGELEPLDLDVATVSAGATYMLFLTNDGEVYGIGDNSMGQLGGNVGASAANVVRLGISNIRAIAASSMNAAAVTVDGYVYHWGQIVSFEDRDDGELVEFERIRSPQRLANIDNVAAISSGNRFTVAIRGDGTVWGWGINELGVLGDYSEDSDIENPKMLDGLSNILAVSASGAHFLALNSYGEIIEMGQKFYGLMDGENVPRVVRDGIMLPDGSAPTILGDENDEI